MSVSPEHYVFYLRLGQFVLGLLTIWVCYVVTGELFGPAAARATCVTGLLLPTMIFPTAQILTECAATFLTALFLLFLVKQEKDSDLNSAVGLGVMGGLEALLRFNAAALPAFALLAVFLTRGKRLWALRAAIVVLLPILVLLPWLVRNEIVFGGRVLFSTHGGPNAVQGVVAPQGRSQADDSRKRKEAMGWTMLQLETNDASRLALPSEPDLNEGAMRVVPGLWKRLGWRAIPLLGRKVAYLWLSADQITDTKSLSVIDRLMRFGGVICYWLVLGLAVCGWICLRKLRPLLASIFLTYALILTALHLPLVMNTRLRIPLMEPLLVILAGGGWIWIVGGKEDAIAS